MAIVLSVIPSFSVTQGIGAVLSILAVIFGLRGRRVIYKDQSGGLGTAGLVLGIVGFLLNGVIFAGCQLCQHRVSQGCQRIEEELKKSLVLDGGPAGPGPASLPASPPASLPAEAPP